MQTSNRQLERLLQETPRGGHVRSDIVPGTEGAGNLDTMGGLVGEADVSTDAAGPIKAIWGTTVNIQESINMFKDFLLNFTLAQKIQYHNPDEDQVIPDEAHEPYYPKLFRQVGRR